MCITHRQPRSASHSLALGRSAPRPDGSRARWSWTAGLCAAALAWGVPPPAQAAPRGPVAEAGIGIGAVLLSLVYTPAKLLYAGVGAATGLAAYALSAGRSDVFWDILDPSLRGDYLVTQEHLLRQRDLVFVGPNREQIAAAQREFPQDPATADALPRGR
jgi:hypothetical protein